jgi:hypothetical protein
MPTLAIDSLPDDRAIKRAEIRSVKSWHAHRARYPERALNDLDHYAILLRSAADACPPASPEKLTQIVGTAIKTIEQMRVLLRIPGAPKEEKEKRASEAPSIVDVEAQAPSASD